MEVKPFIENFFIIDLLNSFAKSLAYPQLRAFLVDQVDQHLLPIVSLLFRHVHLCSTKRLAQITANRDTWSPFHSWFLVPEKRNTSPSLDIRTHPHSPFFIMSHDMLAFHEISRVPFLVQPSNEETLARASDVFFAD